MLAGCNNGKSMTFEQTYETFWDSRTSEAIEMFNNFAQAPGLAEKGNYTLSGAVTSGVAFKASIGLDSTVANQGMDTESNVGISGQINQPGIDDNIALDSNIQLKMVSGQTYINISKLSLTSAKGNPEVSMIGAFAAILTNKWISLSSSGSEIPASMKGLSLGTLYTLPSVVANSLKTHPIFRETSKETVDGNPVYHMALDTTGLYLVAKDVVSQDAVKAFLGATTFTDKELMDWATEFVANAAFDGTFTVYSKSNIVLTINNVNVDEVAKIKGSIEEDTAHFDLIAEMSTGSANVATIDFAEKGKTSSVAIAVPEQSLNVNVSVNMQTASKNKIAYLLNAIASHPTFNFALNGEVNISKTDAIKVLAPTTFQTIDEIANGFGSLLGGGETGMDDTTMPQ